MTTKNEPTFVDAAPNPRGMVKILLTIIQNNPNWSDQKYALDTLESAMRIAYAYWYGAKKPEYKIDGIEGVK